jgi:hypothetical protein
MNSIECLTFNNYCGIRDAFRARCARHYLGLNEPFASGPAGKDESRCNATLVLLHSFIYPGKLQWCWIAIAVCGRAKHDDGVKAGERSV